MRSRSVALLLALAISLASAGAALADTNRTFVSLPDVLDGLRGGAEQTAGNSYAMVVYVSGGNEALTSVALDTAGKPLLRGLALNVFAQRIGAGDQSIADFLDSIGGGGDPGNPGGGDDEGYQIDWPAFADGVWWQSGFDALGFKSIEGISLYADPALFVDGAFLLSDLMEGRLYGKDAAGQTIDVLLGDIYDCSTAASDPEGGRIWLEVLDDSFNTRIMVYDQSGGAPFYPSGINIGDGGLSEYAVDFDGRFWFFDRVSGTLSFCDPNDSFAVTSVADSSPNMNHGQITIDPWGKIWFSGGDGLSCYDPADPSAGIVSKGGISPYLTMATDSQGRVWFNDAVAGNGQLVCYDPSSEELYRGTGVSLGAEGQSISIAPDGTAWFANAPAYGGSPTGTLVHFTPGADPQIQTVTLTGVSQANYACVDTEGKIWFVDQDDTVRFYDPLSGGTTAEDTGITTFAGVRADGAGNIWIDDTFEGNTLVYSPSAVQ